MLNDIIWRLWNRSTRLYLNGADDITNMKAMANYGFAGTLVKHMVLILHFECLFTIYVDTIQFN